MDVLEVPLQVATDTHEEYMNSLANLLVETTQNSSDTSLIATDCDNLFHGIVDNSRELMTKAAASKHDSAVIFGYSIDAKYMGAPIYDLLFPHSTLYAQLVKFNMKSVMERVTEFLHPLKITHTLYSVFKSNAIEINFTTTDTQIMTRHLLNELLEEIKVSDDLIEESEESEDDPVEGIKKLRPVQRYVGIITVSWKHLMEK
jgi:hypothetical protein